MDAQGSQTEPGEGLKVSRIYKFILAAFLSLPSLLSAVPDSLVYRFTANDMDMSLNFNGVNFSFLFRDDNKHSWVYSVADNYKFALPDYNDAGWKPLSSDFRTEHLDTTHFKGLVWMRLHYKVAPELVGKTFMLRMTHNGASEVFSDGKFLVSFGVVSANLQEEITRNPHDRYFPLTINDTLEHVIAVRYSVAHWREYLDKFDIERIGFNLRFFQFNDMTDLVKLGEYQRIVFGCIAAFLFALATVHLMIFLFERSRKFNLYHSIFVFSLSVLFFLPILDNFIEDPVTSFRISHYSLVLTPVFFASLLTLLYTLFEKPFNKFYYITLACAALTLITRYLLSGWSEFFFVTMFFMTYIGTIIISIKAIRKNFRGARIVGVGVLGVTLLMVIGILGITVLQREGFILAIVCAVLAILSLPVSMSVYLAYDFAGANATLRGQIVQIEELSEKALKEEKEKKEILKNQNKLLEEQVQERTAEIMEQKEIIEEKNKDITDSINYARRIQHAILASREIKYKLFPDAFVLWKPKDIVSGDFYWFAEKNGRRLIAACDCTGHGVPGALMSMIGNNLLNQLVNEKGVVAPDEILEELHAEVRKTLKQDEGNETKDGMDSALLSFIDDKNFEYAGAQRPLWIIRNGELTEVKGTKMSIGGQKHDPSLRFTKHLFEGQKGDLIYIFSDGYADQFNRHDKKLMTRKFKEILLSITDLPMPEQEKYLDSFIEEYKGDLEQTDDILVIGIKI